MKRIERYLQEANKHKVAIDEALKELPMPTIESLSTLAKLQRFAVEIVIFRFSKLQDLLGAKLFRQFLEELGYITEGKNYLELLKELQKEGIVDIDRWAKLRKLRNEIAHEYLIDETEQLEKINAIIKEINYLIEIVQRIEDALGETK